MKLNVTLRRTNALLLLFPLALLTGCATQQKPLVEYRTISQPNLPLPAELTSPIDVPLVPDNMTFGQAVELSAELYGVIEQANIDRAAIRQIESTRQGK
ncbi:peptidase [Pantoea sp. CCBC3-3-1]|uniref:Rz1-like lysis system protein LysC n=1 Tax=Pantoea sp. CCBC3-3-1 TaxID=2490851 RepID=UPI00143CE494|nr:peptidase [Pantoea sp. CCBC3-3-1]